MHMVSHSGGGGKGHAGGSGGGTALGGSSGVSGRPGSAAAGAGGGGASSAANSRCAAATLQQLQAGIRLKGTDSRGNAVYRIGKQRFTLDGRDGKTLDDIIEVGLSVFAGPFS